MSREDRPWVDPSPCPAAEGPVPVSNSTYRGEESREKRLETRSEKRSEKRGRGERKARRAEQSRQFHDSFLGSGRKARGGESSKRTKCNLQLLFVMTVTAILSFFLYDYSRSSTMMQRP